MKAKQLLFSLFALLMATTTWADVEINATNFPDRNFRNWVLSQEYGADGVLTTEEIASATSIDVRSKRIQSLTGIEYFTALTTLDCGYNQLNVLDVSKNTKLTRLVCNFNHLKVLDVSQNTALKDLYCSSNQLTSLDVSHNTALKDLWCDNNQLTSLDVSHNTALTGLECYSNQLTSLNVSKNTALTRLWCENNQLTSLDVSHNTALTSLWCDNNQLTSLDVSKNTALTSLNCGNNQLTSLDVSKNTALTTLECYQNQIKDKGMDALVKSLPTTSSGQFDVINEVDDQNEMNETQVLTAKAKGWIPYYLYNNGSRQEYEGCELYLRISKENFQDENFRGWLREQSYGKDGLLTKTEIAGVTNISVIAKQIQSLKGIEFFTELKYLSCGHNELTTLDVSQNTALTTLDCYSNQLTALDVSQNTALKTLYCYNNKLTTFDVSGCTALTTLDCYRNQIKDEGMDALVESLPTTSSGHFGVINEVDDQNEMTEAQVLAAKAKGWKPCYLYKYNGYRWQEYEGSEHYIKIIEENFVDENFRIWLREQSYGADGLLTRTEIAEVTSISVGYKNIQSLKGIEFFTALTTLTCYGNQLTALDMSQNTALTSLDCGYNQLTSLDLSQKTALTYLNCRNNKLTTLDVSGCTALTTLYSISNWLTTLDVSGCTTLTTLTCGGNQLTSLDVSGCTALTTLTCGGNQLTSLDVSGCTALTTLTCGNNQLTSLDLSQNTALTTLTCGYNQLTSLDMSQNTALTSLSCDGIQLTTLDVSQNTVLTSLSCDGIQLTTLDVSQNTALTSLSCENNQLTSLDVSQNTALTSLSCDNNQLTSLDVSQNTALTSLHCYGNKLTTLDMSQNTALKELRCYQNYICGDGMDVLVASLPTTSHGEIYVNYNENEGNEMTYVQVNAAKAKGWTSYERNGDLWQVYEGLGAFFEISKENFPDAKFRTWVLSQEYGTDGKLSRTEIAKVKSIDVNSKGIQTLQGIEFFTALTTLYCYGNQLTSLDVSKNTALTRLSCYGNQLTELDMSQNTALTMLYCFQNQISGDAMDALVASLPTTSNGIMYVIHNENEGNEMTYVQVDEAKAKGWTTYYHNGGQWQTFEGMDAYFEISEENFPDENFRSWVLKQEYGKDGILSKKEIAGVTRIATGAKGIQNLQGIEFFTALKELTCYNNQLTALDLSHNTALKKLQCYNNKLTKINLPENTEMTLLYCYQNEIAGTAMDTFVENLPTVSNGIMRVIYDKNEQNEMTTEQATTAKAKGWSLQYFDGSRWQVYDGPDDINGPTPDPSRNGGEVYDLQGRKIPAKHQRGVYIENGRKVLY